MSIALTTLNSCKPTTDRNYKARKYRTGLFKKDPNLFDSDQMQSM